MVLALGRSNPLKNLPLTLAAWRGAAGAPARAVPVRDRARARLGGGDALRGVAERRGGQRALQPRHGVRADLDARGLRAAAARGDGDGGRRGVHRRPRQPGLLRGRRELPDARARPPGRYATRFTACSPTPSCASGSAARASRRRATTRGSGGSTRSRGSSPRWRGRARCTRGAEAAVGRRRRQGSEIRLSVSA